MIEVEQGNTVRVEVDFKDFNGVAIDPEQITFKVYDLRYKELSSVPLTTDNKAGDTVGEYYIDTKFDGLGTYYIEFLGVIQNRTTLKREKVSVVFNT